MLVAIGVLLLLNNFLLIGDFNVIGLLPLILVLIGAQILIQGDFTLSQAVRSFGITRGSVQAGTLEISAASIDVKLGALQREGRLIAGQFAAESRPRLNVADNHATLGFYRAETPWYNFADWQISMARDLPWQIFSSSHLGQITADLSHLIIQSAHLATGLGDIHLICPQEAFQPLQVRSALGTIHITTPQGYATRITVKGGRLFGVHVDNARYEQIEAGIYVSRETHYDAPVVEVTVQGTFGDAYLA